MFPIFPIVPWHIAWLEPWFPYAPLIWLSGVICLWLTRYTHQLAQRWGERYYWLSAIVRPLGVLLILVGWLAVLSKPGGTRVQGWGFWLIFLGWDGRPTMVFWLRILCGLGTLLSLAFGLWAIKVLGLRRSFLYRRLDDPLITDGPYSIVRHPQFLSAIGVTFFYAVAVLPMEPYPGWSPYVGPYEIILNWALFTVALWLLAVLEDRELAAHFGAAYAEYARRVPRLFPN